MIKGIRKLTSELKTMSTDPVYDEITEVKSKKGRIYIYTKGTIFKPLINWLNKNTIIYYIDIDEKRIVIH